MKTGPVGDAVLKFCRVTILGVCNFKVTIFGDAVSIFGCALILSFRPPYMKARRHLPRFILFKVYKDNVIEAQNTPASTELKRYSE